MIRLLLPRCSRRIFHRENSYTLHGYTPDCGTFPDKCAINCCNRNEIFAFHPGGVPCIMGDASVRFLP